ncbi:hypothetical protein Mgra_00004767, partial [Meloidogyne graminicola]
FYSISDDSIEGEEEEYPNECTPLVYENAVNGVDFPSCYGKDFKPPKCINMEIETQKREGFFIVLYGPDGKGHEIGYLFVEFSTFEMIKIQLKMFKFETGKNVKLDFCSMENNIIKIVITNPDNQSFFEYFYNSTKEEIEAISMIKYGGGFIDLP